MHKMRTSFASLVAFFEVAAGYKTGLIGYGQYWYDPACAYSCRAVIASAPLDCPDMDNSMSGMNMSGMDMNSGSPSASCIADNIDFLSTLAYCMGTRCPSDGVNAAKLEAYWADQATGDPAIAPEWTYGAVLANTSRPERTFKKGDTLNYTALISDADYQYQYDFDRFFDWEEAIQSTYVIVIIAVGVATPVVLSAMNHAPFLTSAIDKLRPYIEQASVAGYNMRILPYSLGNAPTVGQGLWILMFLALNIILGAITYQNFPQTHPWGFSKSGELLAYVGYRTGHISFALLPLTVLFSSRNNILLWLTDWPFSTFVILHRWVARICTLHAIVHSITLLAAYIDNGTYSAEVHKPYWAWGIVATLCLVIILFQSSVWFRRNSYEFFLILHVLLAVFVIVGCWYHIYYWKAFSGIYELWLYMVIALWFFDRLARVLRVVKNGIRRADVVELSPESDVVRLDITGVRWPADPGRYAFVHFPTLRPLGFWESHPFSITHTAMLRPVHNPLAQASSGDVETNKPPRIAAGTGGISIYVKRHAGITSLLHRRVGIPVLLDGPYRGNPSRDVLKCDRVLLVGGGIGITGLLAWTRAHVNVKLAWSLRETDRPLLQDLEFALSGVADNMISVGQRLDVEALLAHEVESGWERVGVVVCGPAGLCDDARMAVVGAGKKNKTVFVLETDVFSW
ncbi:uncharacterized protein PgNI_02363 [Pyricularia grisea]|uniref:FAD-binding FR-type domain-containing protein n=1 Tax=Pyricularia grisea TaxID=148305 RepID=A0A6P8BFC5_PYRGI|nr:uncharacterized protein PgNI_02363 [Pyricularia grisea]TLD15415.1 hypothetical protein PgNI_02363 [Pyricularia grisea]